MCTEGVGPKNLNADSNVGLSPSIQDKIIDRLELTRLSYLNPARCSLTTNSPTGPGLIPYRFGFDK